MIVDIASPILFVLIFLFFALFDVFGVKIKKAQHDLVLGLLLLGMVLFAGSRWSIWSTPDSYRIFDYAAYKHVFDNPLSIISFGDAYVSSDNYIRSMDPGYVFLSTLFAKILPNVHVWFLLYSLTTIMFFYGALRRGKMTRYIFVVLFIYIARLYFQYNFIMMRQALAMAILWWSISYVGERHFWKFLLCVTLASIQHFSAFIFLVVYWLPRFKLSNRFIYSSLGIAFAMTILGLWDIIIQGGIQVSLSALGLDARLSGYILDIQERDAGMNVLNLLEILPFFYFAMMYKKQMEETKEGHIFFNMFILYIFLLFVVIHFMALARITSYFIIPYLYIAHTALSATINRNNRILIWSIILVYFMIYATRFIIANFTNNGYGFFLFHI